MVFNSIVKINYLRRAFFVLNSDSVPKPRSKIVAGSGTGADEAGKP